MAFNAFLKIDGIDGEANEDKHKNWIEILEFHFGVSQSDVMGGGQGSRGAGRADFQHFTFHKVIDKSSPNLMLYCASGKPIPKVTLEVNMAAGQKTKYQSIVLEKVMVSSVTANGSAKGDSPRPQEVVSLAYGKITYEYTPVKDGQAQGAVKQGWDLEENKSV